MFEREHHRNVAFILQALDPAALATRRCYFGGGTAMALRYGEYRESVDIDFLVSDLPGYRELRQMLGGASALNSIARKGLEIEVAREVVTDQYGIRTRVRSGASIIKLEIVFEARIELETPGPGDHVCGIATLTPLDMAAEKLLANTDRWYDDAVFSRDLIDLAMQGESADLIRRACAKAEGAYGTDVRAKLLKAVEALRARPHRLDECMAALGMQNVTKAQLLQRLRRLNTTITRLESAG